MFCFSNSIMFFWSSGRLIALLVVCIAFVAPVTAFAIATLDCIAVVLCPTAATCAETPMLFCRCCLTLTNCLASVRASALFPCLAAFLISASSCFSCLSSCSRSRANSLST
eukprot:Lithocolla_globosa_v1_NODE_10028_length_641_cov_63.930034.p2 type:complete len:111 gc:universal NODE_10028_length_641_cov_63.930034:223-555(+)